MLQAAAQHPDAWKTTWQSYLLTQLNNGQYSSYQEAVLLWASLFPEEKEQKPLADAILAHYYNGSPLSAQRFAQRFMSYLSEDLRYLRYLRYLRNTRNTRNTRELLSLRNMRYLRYLQNMLLTKEVTNNALIQLAHNGSASSNLVERVDLLNILVGRLLHIDEAEEMEKAIEQESMQIVDTVLGYLTANGTSNEEEINDVVLDIVRSLPLRSANEITYALNLAERSTNRRVQDACVYALQFARPKTDAAWVALEVGKGSRIEAVRKAMEKVLGRRK